MKTGKWKKVLSCAAFLAVLALAVSLTAAVLRPAHTAYGSNWDTYGAEPEDSVDVLFLGGSAAYGGWIPGVIYGESGLTGYVMAGSQQPANVTYWYLKQCLKTQHPQVVVMEGKSLLYEEYTSYMELNIHYMPWGVERVMATIEGAPREDWLNLFFDLYTNHGRWKELTPGDFKKVLTPAAVSVNKGYTPLRGTLAEGTLPDVQAMPISAQQYQANLDNYARIARLCQEEGIDLIITINPTYRQFRPEVWQQVAEDLAAIAPQASFVNWSEAFEEIGLEPERHLYDLGHLNVEGAQLFSAYTGQYLKALGYTPRLQTEKDRLAWEETARTWDP